MLTLSPAKRRILRTMVIVAGVLVIAGFSALVSFTVFNRNSNPLPSIVKETIPFSPLIIPTSNSLLTTDNYQLTVAEDETTILTFDIKTEENKKVTVSQYAQPSQFSEIPEFKDQFLTNVAKQYATVQTSNGTIYLGKLTKQNNKQIGILIERGLLVFINPMSDINEATWRDIGDSLEIEKISR